MIGISRNYSMIEAVEKVTAASSKKQHDMVLSKTEKPSGDGSFDVILQQNIMQLEQSEQKGNNHMSMGYDDLSPEEKKSFDEGYDDWKRETGADTVTDEDMDAMYDDYMDTHADDSLMDLATDDGETPENPFLAKIMEGTTQSSMGKQRVVQDVRQMIEMRIQDIQQADTLNDATIEGMNSEYNMIQSYWEQHNLSEADEIPAYVADETRFNGTPSDYYDYMQDKTAEIESARQAEHEEFFRQIYEASAVTSKSENGYPLLIDSCMRKELNTAFDNAYETYEKQQFDTFLNAMREAHGVPAKTTVTPGMVDYSKDVTVQAEQPAKTLQSETQAVPRPVVAPAAPAASVSAIHRGMEVYNTTTDGDDWSFDEHDNTSDDEFGQ